MNRFSVCKNWWRTTPILTKCKKIYMYTAITTFGGLFTGNMYHSIIMSYKNYNNGIDCVFYLGVLSNVSFFKSLIYAIGSPLLVPFAMVNWLYYEPRYIALNSKELPYKKINIYGLLQYIIPPIYICHGFPRSEINLNDGEYWRSRSIE